MRSLKKKYNGKDRPLEEKKTQKVENSFGRAKEKPKYFQEEWNFLESKEEQQEKQQKCLVIGKHIKEGRCAPDKTIRNAYDRNV